MTTRGSTVRRIGAAKATLIAVPLTAAVVPLVSYLGVVSVAGVVAGRRVRRSSTGTTQDAGGTRFAILVPAHDEEAVIARCVGSLVDMAYPAERFGVHVVADNCTDRTAEIARGAGAHVHERTDPVDPGKGAALNWLHDRLVDDGAAYDAFVVVDADTTVDAGFLAAMDRAVRDGAHAAQGFYDVLDPGASASASLRAAALACRHHLRPLGRTAVGASCGLFGNGMVFTADTLASHRWSGHLTEDLEMGVELLLEGERVRYVPDARVRAEMPDALDASVTQHQRWEAGRVQVLKSTFPALVRAVGRGPRGRRLAALDAAFDVAVPPLSVLVAAQVAAGACAGAARAARRGPVASAPPRAERRVVGRARRARARRAALGVRSGEHVPGTRVRAAARAVEGRPVAARGRRRHRGGVAAHRAQRRRSGRRGRVPRHPGARELAEPTEHPG